jgi:hypothetical protein
MSQTRGWLIVGGAVLVIVAVIVVVAALEHKAENDHQRTLHAGINFAGLQHLSTPAKPAGDFDTAIYNTTIKKMDGGGVRYSGRGGLYAGYCEDFQLFNKSGKPMDPNQLTNQTFVDVYLAHAGNTLCVRWVAVAGATVPGAQAYMDAAFSR